MEFLNVSQENENEFFFKKMIWIWTIYTHLKKLLKKITMTHWYKTY
jgi:hypothetical protein